MLCLIFTAGLALRLQVAYSRPVHDDEIWSLMLSTGRGSVHLTTPANVLSLGLVDVTSPAGVVGVARVPLTLGDVTHPPLYFTALGAWRLVFGGSPLTARSLSIVASVAMLALTFDSVRRLLSIEAALWAIAPLAIARPFIDLTTQARPYALSLAFGALATAGFIRLMAGTTRRGATIMLAAGVIGLCLSHYFAAGVVLALAIAAALCPPAETRRRALLAVLLPAALAALLWVPGFLQQQSRGRLSLADPATAFLTGDKVTPLSVAGHLADAPGRLLFPSEKTSRPVLLAVGPLMLLAGAITLRSPATRRSAALLLLLAAGGVLAPTLLDLARHSAHLALDRYVVFAFPPLLALATVPLFASPAKPDTRLVPGGVLALALLSRLPANAIELGDFREVTRIVAANAAPEDVVVFTTDPGKEYFPRMLWLTYNHFSQRRSSPAVIAIEPLPAGLRNALSTRTCWVIAVPGTNAMNTILPDHIKAGQQKVDFYHTLTRYLPRVHGAGTAPDHSPAQPTADTRPAGREAAHP